MSSPQPNNNEKLGASDKPHPIKLVDYIPTEGWSWVPIILGIAVILPVGIWTLPSVPSNWLPNRDDLTKIAILVVVAAVGLKVNTWLKNCKEAKWISKNLSSIVWGSETSDSASSGHIQITAMTTRKPLAKSSTGQVVAKQSQDNDIPVKPHSKIILTMWGGTESSPEGTDLKGNRALQKKSRKKG